MESLQKTMDDLSLHFHKTMEEFQINLQSAIPATSPTSNITAQFSAFRTFVLSSLKSLQGQVDLLSRQLDQQESRSRRKILLIHGVPEVTKEDVPAVVVKVIQQHNLVPGFSSANISRCHRVGRSGGEKPRPLLVKFREHTVKNNIWYNKKCLRGTGITLAEFLTKSRYEVFVAARQQVGVSKCWTKDGQVILIAPTGKRQSITSKAELSLILSVETTTAQTTSATVTASNTQGSSLPSRSRRDKVNKK